MTPRQSARRTTVVVVESNKTQRSLLRRVLEEDGTIEVVGDAAGSAEAVELVRAARPHVVTLDLQVEGGGIQAIGAIMQARPTPILVLSVAVEGAWATRAVDALAAGAAEVLPKPLRWDDAAKSGLRGQVRSIAGVRVRRGDALPTAPPPRPGPVRPDRVVAIGASTGGPVAVSHVLSKLQAAAAPILVVQHLHADFVAGFVTWLAKATGLPVRTARHGERLKPGVVYVGPGNVHLRVGGGCSVVLGHEPDRIHRPSADELFSSVADHFGAGAVGVLLTGMGADGAKGLLHIREAGGATIAQDEATSAVFGMPQAAVRLGAARRVLPLDEIGDAVMSALSKPVAGR